MTRLRGAAVVAAAAVAAGSLGLMLLAGRHAPRFLVVVFVFWVLSPFAALLWADSASARWTSRRRAILHVLTLVVALASLAVYTADALGPPHPQAAFVFVIVAPVSWLLIGAVFIVMKLYDIK